VSTRHIDHDLVARHSSVAAARHDRPAPSSPPISGRALGDLLQRDRNAVEIGAFAVSLAL